MRKAIITLLTVCLALSGTDAFAQLSSLEGRWIAGGGYITFNAAGSQADKLKDMPAMPGFYVGVSYDYAFSTIEGLSFEPGAYIMHFGKTYKFGTATEEKPYHSNYLSIPAHLKYTFPAGDVVGLGVFTGPRLNLGGAGNMFSVGDTYPGLRPVDAQWDLGLVVELQQAVILRGGYNTGLTNGFRDKKGYGKVHREGYYVGVGFVF